MSDKLHVGVMGAGSIGCYVGGKLLASDAASVTLIGRARVQKETADHGLTLSGLSEKKEQISPGHVKVSTDPADLAGCDVIVVCVKSAQTDEVGRELAASIADASPLVVSFQNGVAAVRALRRHFPADQVVPAIVGFNVVGRGEGVFHRGTDGPLVLEDLSDRRVHDFSRTLLAAGFDVEMQPDIGPHQWTKLLVNLNNAISALSDVPTQQLLGSTGYRRIMAAVLSESLLVLKAAGIPAARLRGVPVGLMPHVLRLPDPLVRFITSRQMKVDSNARSSIWEDLSRGRNTEVDFLNGEIVALADPFGVSAPINQGIVELIHQAERAGTGSPKLDSQALWAALSPAASR